MDKLVRNEKFLTVLFKEKGHAYNISELVYEFDTELKSELQGIFYVFNLLQNPYSEEQLKDHISNRLTVLSRPRGILNGKVIVGAIPGSGNGKRLFIRPI